MCMFAVDSVLTRNTLRLICLANQNVYEYTHMKKSNVDSERGKWAEKGRGSSQRTEKRIVQFLHDTAGTNIGTAYMLDSETFVHIYRSNAMWTCKRIKYVFVVLWWKSLRKCFLPRFYSRKYVCVRERESLKCGYEKKHGARFDSLC